MQVGTRRVINFYLIWPLKKVSTQTIAKTLLIPTVDFKTPSQSWKKTTVVFFTLYSMPQTMWSESCLLAAWAGLMGEDLIHHGGNSRPVCPLSVQQVDLGSSGPFKQTCMRTDLYEGGKGPSRRPHLLPCTSLHLWLFEIPTLPALFLSNPYWGNLGLLSTATSICTWHSSWVHSSGKCWLLQSQCEESAHSKSSAWGWKEWKMENMLILKASHSFGKNLKPPLVYCL